MSVKMKKIITGILFLFILNKLIAQQPIYVGIPSERFNYFVSSQRNSNWCWAASLQMIFNYYGVTISQEQIVGRSYGVDPNGILPNWTGSFEVITMNLNNWSVDNFGRYYAVQSSLFWGAPTPLFLIQELSAQKPVLIGYKSGPSSGHAVVVTALSYIPTPNGPSIQTIIVRDPWPSQQNIQNMGRVEYPGLNFANLIQAHWYVRIQ